MRAARAADGRAVAVELFAHGTSTAFVALGEGKADIGMASRSITDEEIAATKSLGDLRSAACEYVIALDGVAVIVNAANPVRSLSIAQVKALFSGRIENWSDLGGAVGPVKIYARDEKSGTTDTFKSLVLGKDKVAATARRYEDSAELSDAVSNDPSGIGYIGMPYVRSSRALAISDGDTTAFRPTRMTVATEDYPLSRRLYFYLPVRSSVLARKFVEFAAVSDEGQQIAERVGFVGQVIKRLNSPPPNEEPAASRDVLPAEYLRLTRGAERLEFALRFRFGSAKLDNLALQNVKRIALRIESEAGKVSVLVFGFGDNRGSVGATLQVSQERADAVAAELRTWGPVASTVQGFGAAAPLANNDTEAGRERNRRVEVWISTLRR
jgi:phosphate transport system substrate-binding protein